MILTKFPYSLNNVTGLPYCRVPSKGTHHANIVCMYLVARWKRHSSVHQRCLRSRCLRHTRTELGYTVHSDTGTHPYHSLHHTQISCQYAGFLIRKTNAVTFSISINIFLHKFSCKFYLQHYRGGFCTGIALSV